MGIRGNPHKKCKSHYHQPSIQPDNHQVKLEHIPQYQMVVKPVQSTVVSESLSKFVRFSWKITVNTKFSDNINRFKAVFVSQFQYLL